MIISEWEMYWITRLTNINAAATIICIITAVGSVFLALFCSAEDCWTGTAKRTLKKLVAVAIVSFLLALFVPDAKEYVAIKVLPAISRNEDVQKIPGDTALFVRKQLEEWIAEITKTKKDK